MEMHSKNIQSAGKSLSEASKVLIMLHGRGADAGDILSLAPHLDLQDFALIAPQATNHAWYPYSFLEKPEKNELWLTSALSLIKEIVEEIKSAGFSSEKIYFLGFSQGACLALEYVTRNAEKYGGVAAFTGGLIGDHIYTENYQGDFHNTPVFISSGDEDPHVPLDRVKVSAKMMKSMQADVHVKIYPGRPHAIIADEIDQVNAIIFK